MRVGAPDESLTRFSGLAAVAELVDRLGVIERLDAAVGPIKARERGFTAGQVLVGMAAAQLCGEDFLVGLDRHRADAAGQALTPVPGLASTTAAGLARRVTEGQWVAVETGLGDVHATALDLLARVDPDRARALRTDVTIDMDTTDVEVYGRRKQGVAFNHQGQRVGRPHVATWADTATVLAADLGDGRDDPRATCADLLGRALATLPAPARAGRIRLRADAGYFAGQLARAALFANVEFAIGARRTAPLWRLLDSVPAQGWTDAIDMTAAQVAVADYCPDWCMDILSTKVMTGISHWRLRPTLAVIDPLARPRTCAGTQPRARCCERVHTGSGSGTGNSGSTSAGGRRIAFFAPLRMDTELPGISWETVKETATTNCSEQLPVMALAALRSMSKRRTIMVKSRDSIVRTAGLVQGPLPAPADFRRSGSVSGSGPPRGGGPARRPDGPRECVRQVP